jgi:glycosyltransferase involved in cell wall biosynthesis
LKILQVVPYFYPAFAFGGPVKVAYSISKELVKRGHDVTVYTTDVKSQTERFVGPRVVDVDGIEVHYMRNLSMFSVKTSNLFLSPELIPISRANIRYFDIVHLHEFTTFQNIILGYYASKANVPYVLQPHGSLLLLGRKKRKLLFNTLFGNRILRNASKVIALSSVEKSQCRDVNVPDEKIEVIPNGLDMSDYSSEKKGVFKKRFKIDNSKRIILYLGRIHETKGIDLLIKAFAHLIGSLNDENLLLVIAGPDDGALISLKSLVQSLGISDLVVFTGFIENEDKLNALADATIFVTPTFYGFPMTFLEACAMGTPIITTSASDNLDWIAGQVGMVCSPEPRDLAKTMHKIINDNELRTNFSNRCREIVKQNFSIETIVDDLELTYTDVINTNQGLRGCP